MPTDLVVAFGIGNGLWQPMAPSMLPWTCSASMFMKWCSIPTIPDTWKYTPMETCMLNTPGQRLEAAHGTTIRMALVEVGNKGFLSFNGKRLFLSCFFCSLRQSLVWKISFSGVYFPVPSTLNNKQHLNSPNP